MMQFESGVDKLAYHLYGREYTKLHNGLEIAKKHVQNFMSDLNLSSEGVALKLGFSEDIGRLGPGEAIGEAVASVEQPVEQAVETAITDVKDEAEKIIDKIKKKKHKNNGNAQENETSSEPTSVTQNQEDPATEQTQENQAANDQALGDGVKE